MSSLRQETADVKNPQPSRKVQKNPRYVVLELCEDPPQKKTFVGQFTKTCSKYHNIDQQSSGSMRSKLPLRGDSPRSELKIRREKSADRQKNP